MTPKDTIHFPLRLTSPRSPRPSAACLDAWKCVDEVSGDADPRDDLARRCVGVRPTGRGELSIERMGDGADVVGHLVLGDSHPIPAFAGPPGAPDLTCFWLGCATTPGYVVLSRQATARLRQVDPWFRRCLPAAVSALCLPLAIVPTPAMASVSARRTRSSSHTEVAADTVQEPVAGAPAEPSPPAASATEPPPATAATPVVGTDPLPDSAWNALSGKRVRMTKADGFSIAGTLVAVDDQTASVAIEDGSIVVVPRTSVTSVRLEEGTASPAAAVEDGDSDDDAGASSSYRGLLIGGSIMVGVGGSLVIAGATLTGYFAANCSTYTTQGGSMTSCAAVSQPAFFAGVLLVPGLLMTGGGATMLGIGVKRKKEAARKAAQISVSPRLGRNGWGGTLQIRF